MQTLKAASVAFALASLAVCAQASGTPLVYRVDHVVDGDTIALRNGQRVRLVQIDTPEVFFGTECYGRAASAQTKRLLPFGSRVRLFAEPATDRVDQYGRLLRYVVRINGAVNVNLRLVAVGAAAPYFYNGRRGRYAVRLEVSPRGRRRGSSASGKHAHARHTIRTTPSKPGTGRRGQ
jgi:endonuclease YncB( thermonuclease family)